MQWQIVKIGDVNVSVATKSGRSLLVWSDAGGNFHFAAPGGPFPAIVGDVPANDDAAARQWVEQNGVV